MAKRTRRQSSSNQLKELDIVIPVYGRPDLLTECLNSLALAAFDVDYQLTIVDDFSPDKPAMEVIYNSLNSDSRILENYQNRGFPATANRGVAAGKAPAILILNSDVTLQPGAVRKMLDTLYGDQAPKGPITAGPDAPVGVVGPKLLFPETANIPPEWRGKIQHAGLAISGAGRPFHIHKGWSADNERANYARTMQAVTGACLMIKRELWHRITENQKRAGDPSSGAFNEIYGLGTYEDVELCFAARGNGYRVVYEPAAVGYHHVGASVASHQERGYPLTRNHSIFMARCGHLMIWDEWLLW